MKYFELKTVGEYSTLFVVTGHKDDGTTDERRFMYLNTALDFLDREEWWGKKVLIHQPDGKLAVVVIRGNLIHEANGLLFFSSGHPVDLGLADDIARANGMSYAEQFVKEYAGKRVWIDHNLKVVTEDA